MRQRRLCFRVDASASIGTGHFMRCLALAQAWQDAGGSPVFLTRSLSPELKRRLAEERILHEEISATAGTRDDARRTAQAARAVRSEWIVVDGYSFGANYQDQIKEASLRLAVIDDFGHAKRYAADLIINQNIGVTPALYTRREPHTELRLGTKYFMLRREFLQARRDHRRRVNQNVLITMGGADQPNVSLKAVRALQSLNRPRLQGRVVAGPLNPHRDELKNAIRQSSTQIDLVSSPSNMVDWMAGADLAVAAGGSSSYELAYLGVPSLLVPFADNQKPVAKALHRQGVAVHLGFYDRVTTSKIAVAIDQLLEDKARREEMVRRGRACVDGQGPARVAMELMGRKIRLRQAAEEDARLLWEWANESRPFSFSTDPISWTEHKLWFAKKLKDPACQIFIALNPEDAPVGQARFDMEKNRGVISISVAAKFRGQGFGSEIINLACAKMWRTYAVGEVRALVRTDNERSLKAFAKCGFSRVRQTLVKSQPAIELILEK